MRIAISVEKKNDLDSTVAHHFGRCPFFAIVDVEGTEIQTIEVIENPFFSGHEVGEVPGFIKEQKVDVMLSGGMGGRAIQFFKELDIEASTGADGTVRSALKGYFGGELSEAAPCVESVEHGHEDEH